MTVLNTKQVHSILGVIDLKLHIKNQMKRTNELKKQHFMTFSNWQSKNPKKEGKGRKFRENECNMK